MQITLLNPNEAGIMRLSSQEILFPLLHSLYCLDARRKSLLTPRKRAPNTHPENLIPNLVYLRPCLGISNASDSGNGLGREEIYLGLTEPLLGVPSSPYTSNRPRVPMNT